MRASLFFQGGTQRVLNEQGLFDLWVQRVLLMGLTVLYAEA